MFNNEYETCCTVTVTVTTDFDFVFPPATVSRHERTRPSLQNSKCLLSKRVISRVFGYYILTKNLTRFSLACKFPSSSSSHALPSTCQGSARAVIVAFKVPTGSRVPRQRLRLAVSLDHSRDLVEPASQPCATFGPHFLRFPLPLVRCVHALEQLHQMIKEFLLGPKLSSVTLVCAQCAVCE